MKSWPAPKKRLKRFASRYLFSERSDGWLFIVDDYRALLFELDNAVNARRERDRGTPSGYQDPFERLQASDT
jgi:hypothetical protein